MADAPQNSDLRSTVKLDYDRIAAEFGGARPRRLTALVSGLAAFFGALAGTALATWLLRGH